jgi:hypothetical protein
VVLAENVPAFRLDVTPDKAGDLDAVIAGIGERIPRRGRHRPLQGGAQGRARFRRSR